MFASSRPFILIVKLCFIALLLLKTSFIFAQSSDDCTQHTSPVTLDGTTCKNYVFTGALDQLTVTGTASATVDGIYFAPGSSCTRCTFDLNGVTVNNMIYGAAGFSFSGGSLSLDGVQSPIIAFEGMSFEGDAVVKIVNCKSSFSTQSPPALHPIYNSNGWFPPFIFGINVGESPLVLTSLLVSNNRISAVNTSSSLPYAFIVQGIVLTTSSLTGDQVATTSDISGNEVNCTGCINSAFVVSLQGKTPTSDADPLNMGSLLNITANKDVVAT